MRLLIILLIQSLVFNASAQGITGIWRGSFSGGQSSLMEQLQGIEYSSPYKYEVQIKDVSGQLKGVTYSYRDTSFFGKASFSGTFSTQTNRVLLQEKKMLELRMSVGGSACIMTCYLQYEKLGKEEFLEGPFTAISVKDSGDCGRGRVRLRKVPFSDFYKEPFLSTPKANLNTPPDPRDRLNTNSSAKPPVTTVKPPVKKTNPPTVKKMPAPVKKTGSDSVKSAKPVLVSPPLVIKEKTATNAPKPTTPSPSVIAQRENVLITTIEVETPEITVKLYDNGVIDNDTISVYRNNKLVLSKKRLTTQPLVLKLEIENPEDVQELVMVADNMGEIPPNTSLMVIEAGTLRKEVRITSTWQKNAMVRFKLKK